MKFYAHSKENEPPENWQPLEEHLRNVAKLAAEFPSAFGAEAWGRDAGWLHDVGKGTLEWQALMNMFDHDRSAARGEMSAQKLIVFKHDSELGNAPAQKLFKLVDVKKNCGDAPPRSFSDYTVAIDTAAVPAGVELIEML